MTASRSTSPSWREMRRRRLSSVAKNVSAAYSPASGQLSDSHAPVSAQRASAAPSPTCAVSMADPSPIAITIVVAKSRGCRPRCPAAPSILSRASISHPTTVASQGRPAKSSSQVAAQADSVRATIAAPTPPRLAVPAPSHARATIERPTARTRCASCRLSPAAAWAVPRREAAAQVHPSTLKPPSPNPRARRG